MVSECKAMNYYPAHSASFYMPATNESSPSSSTLNGFNGKQANINHIHIMLYHLRFAESKVLTSFLTNGDLEFVSILKSLYEIRNSFVFRSV